MASYGQRITLYGCHSAESGFRRRWIRWCFHGLQSIQSRSDFLLSWKELLRHEMDGPRPVPCLEKPDSGNELWSMAQRVQQYHHRRKFWESGLSGIQRISCQYVLGHFGKWHNTVHHLFPEWRYLLPCVHSRRTERTRKRHHAQIPRRGYILPAGHPGYLLL